MSMYSRAVMLLMLVSSLLISQYPVSGRILKKCDADKELKNSKVIDRSFIAHFVCLMQYDGQFNTSLVKGPGSKASYSYGVFQISSDKWCSRYRPGGECNKKCDDFANDNIQDDIVCANLIFKKEGLKHWPGWVKYCKDGTRLPNLNDCKNNKRADSGESEIDEVMDDVLEDLEEIKEILAELKHNEKESGAKKRKAEESVISRQPPMSMKNVRLSDNGEQDIVIPEELL